MNFACPLRRDRRLTTGKLGTDQRAMPLQLPTYSSQEGLCGPPKTAQAADGGQTDTVLLLTAAADRVETRGFYREEPVGKKSAEQRDPKFILTIVAIFFMAAILVVLVLLVLQMRENAKLASYAASVPEDQRTRVEYATEGVTVVNDPNALQKAVDEMMNAPDKPIALEYQNDATSSDGQNFDCYIANSTDNSLDAFFTIATDGSMSDVLYVSGLLRPGQALEKIKLDRALEPGIHTVCVGISLVDEVDGEQVVDRQMVYNMTFHVNS